MERNRIVTSIQSAESDHRADRDLWPDGHPADCHPANHGTAHLWSQSARVNITSLCLPAALSLDPPPSYQIIGLSIT